MQQDSTASALITELRSQLKEKDYQLEKRASLIRDQTDRIEDLELKVSELKRDLDAAKSEAIRSCECKFPINFHIPHIKASKSLCFTLNSDWLFQCGLIEQARYIKK